MQIATATAADHAEFVAIVNAEIRPDRAKTNAWDDFPLILDPANAAWTLVAKADDGTVAAGLAALIREQTTNCGNIRVAGLGSVVTRPDFRGRGLSRSLQLAMLARLRQHEVPLAVLWTDQPEIYAGRGFAAAGWEYHVDLTGAELPAAPDCRPYEPRDAAAVAALFARHPWRTLRADGDSARLYGMPGTTGLVAIDAGDRPLAAVFCGKGADFPGYVTEWSGKPELVLGLLGVARQRGLAGSLLAPVGAEDLVDALAGRGGGWLALPSGQWCVVLPDRLARLAAPVGPPAAASSWLGGVGPDGQPRPGPLRLAFWGFDSV